MNLEQMVYFERNCPYVLELLEQLLELLLELVLLLQLSMLSFAFVLAEMIPVAAAAAPAARAADLAAAQAANPPPPGTCFPPSPWVASRHTNLDLIQVGSGHEHSTGTLSGNHVDL